MIIELFGLPGTGKSTLARKLEREGRGVRARIASRTELLLRNLIFFFRHPFLFFRLLSYIVRYKGSWHLFLTKFSNLFLGHNAKYQKAKNLKGLALVDQGYFQNILSLFDHAVSEMELRAYMRLLPKPDELWICDVEEKERLSRIEGRGYGGENEARARDAVRENYALAKRLLPEFSGYLRVREVPGCAETKGGLFEVRSLAYVTAARMPTMKAHGVSIAHMCSAFAGQGVRTELIIPTRRNTVAQDIFSFYGVPKSFSTRYIPCVDFLGRGLTARPFFYAQRLFFVRALLRQEIASDIIYTREPEIVAAFGKTHRVVYEAHRWPKGLLGRVLGKMVREAYLVVCNSRGTEAVARAHGCVRTIVAPNGFDPEMFTKETPSREELNLPEGIIALYAGSDASWKGTGVLREAAKRTSNARVVLVGGKQGADSPCVEISGVSPSQVPAYLKSADILVLPNTSESEESERFTSPIKLFEYLAAAKPIVASDLPSIREIVSGEHVVFVKAGDSVDLARAITDLAQHPEERARLSSAARSLSVSYTWSARARKIIDTLCI